ncbi:hypothetical protein PMI01_04203 [Caulobacter sp. AP07]|uniref:hypothetical protein n=1 Tax=Caulobacter sp. AP07 TaxID=1144304 RepID=UPI000271EE2F|nr:hypothetical protein [Caulobacter sp. AP07]EJL26032.1 hypothetical protein PMI01_04203 [Caulobacter sp. AP07]
MSPSLTVVSDKAARIARLHALIDELEEMAEPYEIGGLQVRRRTIKGLRSGRKQIFAERKRIKDWAFHYGGRGELQFNAGLDVLPSGDHAFRIGVGFSLEASKFFHDIELLLPHVVRFDDWMAANPDAYPDLAMWHYVEGERSNDYRPGPVRADFVERALKTRKGFVFLGDRQPFERVDLNRALGVMDRLLPMWDWIERGLASGVASRPGTGLIAGAGSAQGDEAEETLDLDRGRRIDPRRWTRASIVQRVVDVDLRHAELQRRLEAKLLADGWPKVTVEAPIGRRRVDVVAKRPGEMWFFEVTIASSARLCLREAVGQLLEYSMWPGATKPERLVVVGEPPLTTKGRAYLQALNGVLSIRLDYEQLALD